MEYRRGASGRSAATSSCADQPAGLAVDRLRVHVQHLAREVVGVGRQVELTAARHPDQHHLAFAVVLGRPQVCDRARDRVVRLRGREDALGPCEQDPRGERVALLDGDRVHQLLVVGGADQRCHAVIAQPPGVHRVGHEVGTQGVHLEQRSLARGVTEVVAVLTLGQ